MRLLARFLFLMSLLLGISVALAWAWDRNDPAEAVEQPAR